MLEVRSLVINIFSSDGQNHCLQMKATTIIVEVILELGRNKDCKHQEYVSAVCR